MHLKMFFMKYRVYIILFLIIGYSCHSNSAESKLIRQYEKIGHNPKLTLSQLDSLWKLLVFDQGGCLTGSQHVSNGVFGGEGCVMTESRKNDDWQKFFMQPKSILIPFLINQFKDTTQTKIHTCPCFLATNGEVAVYALQNIFKTNWYSLKGFEIYENREGSGCTDNEQTWLQAILLDENQRESLVNAWKQL
jgi:hypothetical protein